MNAKWVLSGPALPCGARVLTEGPVPARPGTTWLDVCMLGQHLPQMYSDADIHELTADQAPSYGLCPDCLGFGDVGSRNSEGLMWYARGIDQIAAACANCGGSGRPALRITVTRGAGVTEGQVRSVPHAYVPPLPVDSGLAALFQVPADMCLACGTGRDGRGLGGEQLHQVLP